MNRLRAKELLPIIQAFADGKDIQWRVHNDTWRAVTNPQFHNLGHYRIKPQLREFTLEPTGDIGMYQAYELGVLGEGHKFKHNKYADAIKVREVIE